MASAPARAITLVGSNGTLVLDELYMIVTEIGFEHEDGCDDDDGFNGQTLDDCEDFESGPHFVSLPLDGTPIVVSTALVASGVYDELELEDLDDDDDDKGARLDDLRNQIIGTVPDWPQKASIFVAGTFQAEGEDRVPFGTFIEAEIEVELDLVPNLEIGNDGSANREPIVDIRPDLWFRDFQAPGWVLDWREWDYDTTGRLLELEIEIENGFIEVEVDD